MKNELKVLIALLESAIRNPINNYVNPEKYQELIIKYYKELDKILSMKVREPLIEDLIQQVENDLDTLKKKLAQYISITKR